MREEMCIRDSSPVEGLTGANCGETLLGVSREVFERSAFIRQSGLAITQDAGLERRVASLISSGDEDTSYTEAYDALKKQLNRRRFNKSGQLPALEAELAEVQQQLDSSVQLQQQLADALERSQALESDVQALSDELAQYDRWESDVYKRQLLVSTRFQVLFHSPPGVLFTFPSRYCSSIGHQVVFRLGGWSPLFPTGFHVSCGTLDPA